MSTTGRIREGETTAPVAVGASIVIPIYIGRKECTIQTIQISAPGLNKTTDKINVAVANKETPVDDFDYLMYWEDEASIDGPWSNFMTAYGPLDMPFEDMELTPSMTDALPGRWFWIIVENIAGNSDVTQFKVRVTIAAEPWGSN